MGMLFTSKLPTTPRINASAPPRTAVVPRSSDGDVSKVGYFFDLPASLRLSLYTIMT